MSSLLDTRADIHQKELDSIFLDLFLLPQWSDLNFFLQESGWNLLMCSGWLCKMCFIAANSRTGDSPGMVAGKAKGGKEGTLPTVFLEHLSFSVLVILPLLMLL